MNEETGLLSSRPGFLLTERLRIRYVTSLNLSLLSCERAGEARFTSESPPL